MATHYIVPNNFKGWIKDIFRGDPKDFEAIEGHTLMNHDQFSEVVHQFTESLCTDPKPINQERYTAMLEVLPPCRFGYVGRYEVFHISERDYGDIVSWFAWDTIANEYYELTQYATIKSQDLYNILEGAK